MAKVSGFFLVFVPWTGSKFWLQPDHMATYCIGLVELAYDLSMHMYLSLSTCAVMHNLICKTVTYMLTLKYRYIHSGWIISHHWHMTVHFLMKDKFTENTEIQLSCLKSPKCLMNQISPNKPLKLMQTKNLGTIFWYSQSQPHSDRNQSNYLERKNMFFLEHSNKNQLAVVF